VHVHMVHTVSVWALAVQVSDFNSSKVSSLQLIGNFFENYEQVKYEFMLSLKTIFLIYKEINNVLLLRNELHESIITIIISRFLKLLILNLSKQKIIYVS
jgi:hypothetical protein